MKACEQAPGCSVYAHGLDVGNRYRALYSQLRGEPTFGAWALPPEIVPLLESLVDKALPPTEARRYHVFHDCGKPRCLTVDADGKRHFPNHSAVSARLFREAFPHDERLAQLVERDMLCHTLKPAQAGELLAFPDAPTLILTAWAELHANAAMFGGFESESFKIKRSRLAKLTKRCCEELR